MQKSSQSRGAVFFRTFAVTIGLVGAFLMLGYLVFLGTRPKAEESAPHTHSIPTAADRLTVLILGGVDESVMPEVCFLYGFLPDKGSIAVCALPTDTLWKTAEGEGTIRSAYADGGAGYVSQQLAASLGIPIDRTVVLDFAGLETLIQTGGTIPYTLAEDLSGTVRGRKVSFTRGTYDLDARAMADLLTVPAPASTDRRSDRCASLLRAMAELHLPGVLTESGAMLYRNLLNCSRTDLTALDYMQRETAAQYLSTCKEPVAICVYIDGRQGRDAYYLSDASIACIQGTYGAAGE